MKWQQGLNRAVSQTQRRNSANHPATAYGSSSQNQKACHPRQDSNRLGIRATKLPRRQPVKLPKRPIEANHIPEPYFRTNLLQRQIGRREKAPGFAHPPLPQPRAGRLTSQLTEQAAKVTFRKPGL